MWSLEKHHSSEDFHANQPPAVLVGPPCRCSHRRHRRRLQVDRAMHSVRQGIPAEYAPGEAFEMQSDTQGQKVRRRDHLGRAQIAGSYFFPTAFCGGRQRHHQPPSELHRQQLILDRQTLSFLERWNYQARQGTIAAPKSSPNQEHHQWQSSRGRRQ